MPGPNMSLAYRDDEIERQNFANEATLRCVPMHCPLAACVTLLPCTGCCFGATYASLDITPTSRQDMFAALLISAPWGVYYAYCSLCVHGAQLSPACGPQAAGA